MATNQSTISATNQINWLAHSVRWLVYVLFLTTPFIFTWVNEELFEFPKMMWLYGFVSLALGLSLADQLVHRSWHWPKTKFDWLIGAFALSQLLSTIFSIHPRTSWFGYYTRFNGGLLSTLTYVSLYYLIVEYFNAKQLIKLVKTGILVGGLVALYAIPEHFGVSPSCLLITKTVGVSCWVQDVQSRVFGTFGQPNWLAAYLITLLPLVAAWLAITKKTLSKLGLILLWLMFLAGVLFTQSRSGILGLGIGVGIWLFLTLWSWFWQPKLTETQPHISFRKRFQTNWIWIGLSLGGLGLIGWFGTPFSPNLANLWSKSFNSTLNLNLPIKAAAQTGTKLDVGGTESGEIRKIVWSGALAVWRRYPVFGSGVETFAYSYYQDRPLSHNNVSEWDFLYNKAHNELLNYLATSGLVGLGSYLALWGGLVWTILVWLKTPQASVNENGIQETKKVLTIAWMAGLTAQFVSNFFGFSTVMINLLWWLGLACIAKWTEVNVVVKNQPVDQFKPVSLTTLEWAGLGIILVSTWWLATKPLAWWQADRDYALSKALFTTNTYQTGLIKLESAIKLSPNEALFWDELANQYSRLVVGLQASPNASESGEMIAQLAQAAIAASDQALALNSKHLDFYKTRARVFINLSQLDPKYLAAASATLTTAQALAPTDPKLPHHLGLVQLAAGATPSALVNLETAVTLKPDYLSAWFDFGKAYELANQLPQAKSVYEHILTSLSPNNPEVLAKLKAINLLHPAQ